MSYFAQYLKKPTAGTTLLIDGDLYLYRACAAAEEEINWGEDIWSLSTDLKVAKKIFQATLDACCEHLETGHFIVCLSDRDNFRKDVDSQYKGGRKKVRKPIGYGEMIKWIKNTYIWFSEPLLEADDVMGIMASAPDSNTIMVSDDKDMKSIPGRLYRPMSGELLTITRQQADFNFLTQALMGDVTDGYAGCPSIGKITAEKILTKDPSWNAVVGQYAKQKLNYDYALTQARLARILRFEDWDVEKNQIILWEPKQCR